MSSRIRYGLVVGVVLVAACGMFLPGITWGLPSRAVDPFLFGGHEVWDGATIQRLAGERVVEKGRGADLDVNPLAGVDDDATDESVVVNATDAQRAEIVRRYRLYSYHPDEMVTLMALAAMRPGEGDFDPKLYQYGGLWVYGVGALLKVASMAGLIELRSDVAYYLDQPEAFGRFYVVARAYVVLWGLVGAWCVVSIVWRLADGDAWAAVVGGLVYAAMPVVVNMAHEAKPHLPGVVLMLLAIRAAMMFVDGGKRRWWWLTCVLCGLAVGMVLTAGVIVVLPLVAMGLRPMFPRQRVVLLLTGMVQVVAVYAATNPYVVINLLTRPEVVTSNLGNTAGMFTPAAALTGVLKGVILITLACSPIVALIGVVGVVVWWLDLRRLRRSSDPARAYVHHHLVWLLVWPGIIGLIPFFMLASGQLAEYARFALYVEVMLALVAVVFVVHKSSSLFLRRAFGGLLVLSAFAPGIGHVQGFVHDTRAVTTRLLAAEVLEGMSAEGYRTLIVPGDPAPYIMPPVDLFSWEIRVCRDRRIETVPDQPTVTLRPLNHPAYWIADYPEYTYTSIPHEVILHDFTPISFADKTFAIRQMNTVLLPKESP